ncbi:pilus assembly protein [Mesorhizobium sp. KR2-14]|uniref:pilus assembly protein n=1 Tax=Mesorhizobium sp. KR2-14 TaxID=3156610 RepID=UPI0032B4E8AF
MLVSRFWKSRSGNFAMMFAIALPAVLAGVGLALDISSLMTARSKLQNALDSAVLAASRLADASISRDDAFQGFFKANIANGRDLLSPVAYLTVEQGTNYIKTSATAHATVALNLGFVFGQSAQVAVASSAYQSTAKLEVALVLDNTGSMGDSNMKALREGATSLITTLQDAKKEQPAREIRAALVPFVTAVNINGEGFKTSWVDLRKTFPTSDPGLNGRNFDVITSNNVRVGHAKLFDDLGVKWKGCVEARAVKFKSNNTIDLSASPGLDDTAPDQLRPETLFVPYFAPDEHGDPYKARNEDLSNYNNSYLKDLASGTGKTDAEKHRSIQMNLSKYTLTNKSTAIINEVAPLTSGPNYACPTPIMPLTSDLDKLKAEVSKMTYWNGSGTNVSEGLVWGYRVLSPGEPYAQGDDFNSDGTSKAVVVFTDGENNVFGQKTALINKSDYGSYNYLDQGRMGSTDRNQALKNVNTMTQTVCTTLKAKGVRVFTVVLGADTAANRELYSNCASAPTDYYPTKDQAQLKAAFRNIAFAISQLYVTN